MATSTFAREFNVEAEKAEEFVKEMTKQVSPTLDPDFKSQFIHVKNRGDILQKALE